MTIRFLLIAFLFAGPCLGDGMECEQDDWSGGPGEAGPILSWGDRFDDSDGIAWRSIPGQLAISSTPLDSPAHSLIDDSHIGSFGICTADVDEDGDTDIVSAADASGKVMLWLNDGQAEPSWTLQYIDQGVPGASAVAVADFDGDGALDVVGTLAAPMQKLCWWRNEGGNPIVWTREFIDDYWPGAFEVTCADVDLDGRMDVLSAAYQLNEAAWWRNTPGDPVTWIKQSVDDEIETAHCLRSADLDGDEDMDMLCVGAEANEVSWWRNDGGDPLVWTRFPVDLDFTGGRSVRAADLDDDGDLDIAGTCWTRHVSWWRNDGGDPVVWTRLDIDSAFVGGHYIEVEDFNGDGRLDLLAAACTGNQIAWYENQGGDPLAWTKHYVALAYTCAIQSCAGDLDGDGDLDVLGASYYWGTFDWWRITEFQDTGELTSSVLDLGEATQLTEMDWEATLPTACAMSVLVRNGDDPGDLGAWSDPISEPGGLELQEHRYLQYRLQMETGDARHSPVLRQLFFRSGASGVPQETAGARAELLGVWPNPFNPRVEISFQLTESQPVSIQVFDLAGRLVSRLASEIYGSGEHRISWKGGMENGHAAPSGIYLLRFESPAGSESRKLTLIR